MSPRVFTGKGVAPKGAIRRPRRKRGPNSLDMKFDSDVMVKEMSRLLGGENQLQYHRVADQVVRAGGRIVASRARKLAPRSSPKDRAKRARKQRAKADWDSPMWKSIKLVVRKYAYNAAAVVGPEWGTAGNKAYFNTSPGGRVRKLWGRNPSVFYGSKLSAIAPQIRNWIVQAFDETKAQQLQAMKQKLSQKMKEIWE